MPAACRMNKHMASLSGDNGEAEGSCPEPAGNRAIVCQSLCNSHLKEALSSPSGLFWEQPGWAIIIMGSPGRLGIDRGAVYWGELIDSCLLIWLSLTGKPNDWKSMASEEAHTKEGSGGHCTCWAWGRQRWLPSVNPHELRLQFSNMQLWHGPGLQGDCAAICLCPAPTQWGRTLRSYISQHPCSHAPKSSPVSPMDKSYASFPKGSWKEGPYLGKLRDQHGPRIWRKFSKGSADLSLEPFENLAPWPVLRGSRVLRCWELSGDSEI